MNCHDKLICLISQLCTNEHLVLVRSTTHSITLQTRSPQLHTRPTGFKYINQVISQKKFEACESFNIIEFYPLSYFNVVQLPER